jgi:mono/diheme cytochrome c family protein
MVRSSLASIGIVIAALAAAPALAADAENGLRISQRWCSSCHVVTPDQKTGSVDVPSFKEIAMKRTDAKALSMFLSDPHPRMNLELSRDEIADVVRYIQLFNPDAIVPEGGKDDKPPEPARG